MSEHGHGHAHGHGQAWGDVATMFEESTWEERYRGAGPVWSGNPNAVLVDEASGLAPGTALDVGCGEGADAVWLAQRGWRVTAADFATAALARGAEHAAERCVADAITWTHADLRTWSPPERAFDLVSSQFMHLPGEQVHALFARLAAAVAPGGTLLVVGHHPSDLETSMPRPQMRELFYTAEEVAERLDPAQWTVQTTDERPATARNPETGEPVEVHFAVLKARRRS